MNCLGFSNDYCTYPCCKIETHEISDLIGRELAKLPTRGLKRRRFETCIGRGSLANQHTIKRIERKIKIQFWLAQDYRHFGSIVFCF